MNKFYFFIFSISFFITSNGFANQIETVQKFSILGSDKELLLKKVNAQIATEEAYINRQLNWIGWDYENLFRLVLINKKFKGNLVLNPEVIKSKTTYELGHYVKMYGEEFYNNDPKMFEQAKELFKSKPNKSEIILTIPNYKELLSNHFISNIWSAYADKMPLNDTAINILKSEFIINNDTKIEGLIYFYQLGLNQKDANVIAAYDLMKNEVLQILNNSDGTISEELKIKAIAAALYVGISNLPVDTYLNFLATYQASRNGTFSNSQLKGGNSSFLYDESINVYGYWALVQIRELIKLK
ncbi:MAG: hypothetical protein IPN09_14950 [Bacteroidetes bacterium]|nr:hypothetical protein [Bacteroidota bacterium]